MSPLDPNEYRCPSCGQVADRDNYPICTHNPMRCDDCCLRDHEGMAVA